MLAAIMSSGMKFENLDGQKLIFLKGELLDNFIETKILDGYLMRHTDIVLDAVKEFRNYKGVQTAILIKNNQVVMPIAFVEILGARYRVHIENVICFQCSKRSGISGTPMSYELYFGCDDPQEVMARSMEMPIKKCKHCENTLSQRHTIWFETEQCS